jgi:hypothetical protein
MRSWASPSEVEERIGEYSTLALAKIPDLLAGIWGPDPLA